MDKNVEKLAKVIRHFILTSSTEAGSGHPSSSLSATDLMAGLFFGGFFKYEIKNPQFANNDRLIFSKGHASPLFYSLWAAAGGIEAEELNTMRKFGSRLEGHPTMEFPFTECATGSLGQGLSVGVGMALNAKYVDKLPYKTYVLLGDSEMAEGSVWEAMEIAQHYKLNNLIGIIDVNRLGQRGETLYGHHTEVYQKKSEAFGWQTFVIDGHNLEEINNAFKFAQTVTDRPVMIIAKTLKGKGVSFIEDKDNWHGKPLSKEEMEKALGELGQVELSLRGQLAEPEAVPKQESRITNQELKFTKYDKPVATRRAYGNALVNVFKAYPNIVVLDAETSNSTYAEIFKKEYPDKFFEMYIAEQNMAGAALGFSRRGKIPFVSTFAAFFSRAFDQVRMSQYSEPNIKFVGSHAGVSIGEDGASQMALEDIATFRTLHDGVVLYTIDGVSTEKLVALAAEHKGNVYIRTTRKDTAILYKEDEKFQIGGSKVLKKSDTDQITVIGAGVTLHEALSAYEELQKEGINIRVIDLYSIKPIDVATLTTAAKETKALISVEDHYQEGGMGEAVRSALFDSPISVHVLAVRRLAKSGKPDELLAYEEIDKNAIIKKAKELIEN